MIPFLQHVRVDLPGKAEGRPGSPYFRQSRRPRGTSSAALSFWELCNIKLVAVILNFTCACVAVLERQIENVCEHAYPCLRFFSGRCARTSALARCPLGLAEGRELLQKCLIRVLRCRSESCGLDCVVVAVEVVEIDFEILSANS
jgi:hypothetical protein